VQTSTTRGDWRLPHLTCTSGTNTKPCLTECWVLEWLIIILSLGTSLSSSTLKLNWMSTDRKRIMFYQFSYNCTQYQSVYAYCLQHWSSTVKAHIQLVSHFGGTGELIFAGSYVFIFAQFLFSSISPFLNSVHTGGFFSNSKCRALVILWTLIICA
jgi:hypothetical protein